MKNNTYLIKFNFSDSVYIGTTTRFDERKKQHLRRIEKFSKVVIAEKDTEIKSDCSIWSAYPTRKGYNLKMYQDALLFFRRTNSFPSIEGIKKLNSFHCDCKSHDGTPCKKALLFEVKYQTKYSNNYNHKPPISLKP
jgi:hypothetical protein